MALVTTVSHLLTLLNSSNQPILPSWVSNLLAVSTTYTTRPEILTIALTTTPTATTINGLAGTSPVTALIINNSTVDMTVLGVASFTQTVRAGKWIWLDQFVTTSQITLSCASSTGECVLVLLK